MAYNSVPQYFRKSYQDFSGGLNDFDDPLVVKQNQFTQLTNAYVNSSGLLEKSKGYSTDGSPFPDDVDSFIRMMVNYKRGTSVDKLVCAALDEGNTNATYKVDIKETSGDGNYAYIGHTTGTADFTNGNTAVTGTGTAWLSHLKAGDKIKADAHADGAYGEIATVNSDTSITLSANYSGATTGGAVAYKARIILHKDYIPSALVFNNNLVITNGNDVPLTYNNTTLNKITDAQAPTAKFIERHKSRVFMAATSGGPSTIYWSAVNDETSWDAAALEIVFANDNGNICGIKSFADSLIVLKDNGNIYQVVGAFSQDSVGEPDFIRRVDTPDNMGTIAGFTAAVANDNKAYFLAKTGVYSLDSRMVVQKVSWNIQDTTDSAVFTSGATSAKSVVYDTKAQFDTGAYSGMRALTAGTLESVNDLYTHSDAYKVDNLCAIKMNSAGDINYVYVGTDGKTVKHVNITLAGTTTSTDIATAPDTIVDISLDMNSAGDQILAYLTSAPKVYYAEKLSAGSWGSATLQRTLSLTGVSLAVKYGALTNTDVYIVTSSYAAADGSSSRFYLDKRVSASWSGADIKNQSTGLVLTVTGVAGNMDLVMKNSDDNLAFSIKRGATLDAATTLAVWGWNSGGGDEVNELYTTTFTAHTMSRTQFVKNSSNERIVTWSDGATIKSRNFDAGSSATVDASFGNHTGVYMNGSNQWSYMRFNSSGTETLVYANSTTLANTTTAVLDVGGLYPGCRGFDSNGTVYASIYFGANADEIIVRRIAPTATWTGPISSDATLTAWGTYDVSGQTANGNTVLHEIAVASSSPPTSYSTITSGSVISTDATLIYARPRVTVTHVDFLASSIESITLNYTGTGIGALLPTSCVFDNEYYLAHGYSGDTGNSTVLLMDRENAWTTVNYPVIFMCAYKNSLYGGGSATGKVFKLNQAYRAISSAYTMTAISKEDLLGSLELEKEVYKIYVIYKIQSAGSFTFSYRHDNFATDGGSSWVDTTIDMTQNGIAEVPDVSGKLRSIQFKVSNSAIDNQVAVVGWVVVYGYLNIR